MNGNEKIDYLKDLVALRDENLISDAEFEKERQRIFGKTPQLQVIAGGLQKFFPTLVWPAVVIIALFSFKGIVVSKLYDAEQISIGSFSLKVKEKARLIGNHELTDAISGLSKKSIEMLMNTGISHMLLVSPDKDHNPKSVTIYSGVHLELEKKGLISFNEPYEPFISWVESLPSEKKFFYSTKDDKELDTRPTGSYSVYEKIVLHSEQLTEKDKLRLSEAEYTLSEKGLLVWKLIAEVVAEQLAYSSK